MSACVSAVSRAILRRLRHAPEAGTRLIAVTGGVAVGKSVFARALRRALLRQVTEAVEIVTSDGFLRSDTDLESAGLLQRKGYPDSYDHAGLEAFFAAIRARAPELVVPVYSHSTRGVVDHRRFARPRWLILEGVYALQPARASGLPCCSIYLDADPSDAQVWYLERFMRIHGWRFATTTDAEQHARQLYERVNYQNLVECIAPLRSQADIVLVRKAGGQWRFP